jgi:hypothetical protein
MNNKFKVLNVSDSSGNLVFGLKILSLFQAVKINEYLMHMKSRCIYICKHVYNTYIGSYTLIVLNKLKKYKHNRLYPILDHH